MKVFDLTPDPKVLIALTHTPLKPMDALSELIDNAIDSFTLARNAGLEVEHPLVLIGLPSRAENDRGEGVLRVRDNGIGMSLDMAEKSLKAGFSGNNPYDSLGLFGMGLNIATGKLARRTTLLTARKEDSHAIKVVIDLVKIQESGSFAVEPQQVEKPDDFEHGSIIEVSSWWPEGNANFGFIRKLIGYGRPRVRKEIGRRYASFLNNNKIRILVDEEPCLPFEHCVWGDNRFVERRGHGKVYAVQRFSKSIGSQTRCTQCFALTAPGANGCPVCESSSIRTIEEKVKGWIGIQRYDDSAHFGIDLIRNGRVIRILEKAAFFEFTDEFGNTFPDYPVDSSYGRIVGEVHLDHVPVDFMKQDFQRSSPEWQRAMTFLRGDSSLQPLQPGAENNISPVFLLYQGYRRVRRFGKHDMYMGFWDEQSNASKRIDRQTERDFLAKFHENQPGFYDDSEWWKLVENADTPPVEMLLECPSCGADNLQSAELCQVCDAILIGRPCIECHSEIALSSTNCPHCGQSQVPEVEEPWVCQICGKTNQADMEKCRKCDVVCGAPNPLSLDYLRENSDRDEDLCFPGCSVKLADGSHSQSIDVECYCVNKPMVSTSQGDRLPAMIFKGERIEVFIDRQHPLFQSISVKPEEIVMCEVAYFLHVSNGRLSGSANQESHSLSNLQWALLKKYCFEALSDSQEQVREDVGNFFKEVNQRLPELFRDSCADIFDEIAEGEKKILVDNLIDNGVDISSMGEMKNSGKFLLYVSPRTVIGIFRKYSSAFFDGALWGQPYATIPDIPESVMDQVREQTQRVYLNCLEDCASFISVQKVDPILVSRTRSSLQYLQRKLEY